MKFKYAGSKCKKVESAHLFYTGLVLLLLLGVPLVPYPSSIIVFLWWYSEPAKYFVFSIPKETGTPFKSCLDWQLTSISLYLWLLAPDSIQDTFFSCPFFLVLNSSYYLLYFIIFPGTNPSTLLALVPTFFFLVWPVHRAK